MNAKGVAMIWPRQSSAAQPALLARGRPAGHHAAESAAAEHAFGGVMDASVDAPRRSFAFGLERLGLVGLRAPAVTFALIVVLSALAVLGPDPAQGRRLALRAVPHRHRGVPALRGDRPPLSLQRVRRAGGGRGQGPPEEAAARGLPPRHHRPAAGRRRRRPHLHALGARQAGRQRLRAADRARRAARRARVRRDHRGDARQRHRQGQVPLARRRAGAGRHRARPQGGGGEGRQGGHRRHRRAAARRSWRRSASSRT